MKSARALLVVLLIAASCQYALAAGRNTITFFVSPGGNDAWSGRRAAPNAEGTDGPLATLTAARDAIRAMRASGIPAMPVRVFLRGGTHYITEPLILEPQDSGTEQCPVTYSAYPGEEAIVSGGRAITGWGQRTDGLWVAQVPECKDGWVFRQLFVDGQRRTLARSPNTGYYHMVGKAPPVMDPGTGEEIDTSKTAFRFEPGDIKRWRHLNDINLLVYYNWETALFRIADVDEATSTVQCTGPSKWPFTSMGGGRQRFEVMNHFDALDQPGEWYLDRRGANLYYYPLPGESLDDFEAVAPVTDKFVVLRGDPDNGKFVEHVRISDIDFRYAGWELEPEGHGDWQAAVTMPACIEADGARDCSIERCEVAHFAGYGVWFRRGCQSNRVEQNHLYDMGCGGLRLGDQGAAGTPDAETHHNVLHNNFIHDGGEVFASAVGIWIGHASDNTISHNEIRDMYYTGISAGWSWGYGETQHKRNEIAYNHIHHVGRGKLHDMAAIYTLGLSEGTTLHHNLIHDVWSSEESGGAGGIYPDEGSSGITIENNVVYRTDAGGLTVHYGKDITVRNNIFAFGGREQVILGRPEEHKAFSFTNNIVYFDEGPVWTAWGSGKTQWTAARNCYWNALGRPLVFLGDKTFADWQKLGFDKQSIVADPMFRDPAKGDFSLDPASPALKTGFVPIDISTAGLTGPEEWVQLPARTPRPDIQFGTRYLPEMKPSDDGFEYAAVGTTVDMARTYGETDKARIRVTDEAAATGKHSLKFSDAPGLDQTWNPHLYYTLSLREGTQSLNFDLMFRKGAKIAHEWRDGATSYHAGPSITVDEKGKLRARDKELADLPADKWIHFEIVCKLGSAATGEYDMTVTVRGQKPVRFENLPCDVLFTRVNWLGFVSDADAATVFYLDNVKLATK